MRKESTQTRRGAFRRVFVAALAISAGAAAFGQNMSGVPNRAATRGVLDWKVGAVVINEQGPSVAAQTAQQLAANGDRHVLMQFSEPLHPAERAALEAAGVKLQDYVGDNAFYAYVPTVVDTAQLSTVAKLRAVQPIAVEWKLDRGYRVAMLGDYAVARPEEQGLGALSAELTVEAQAKEVEVRPFDWVAANVVIHRDVDFNDAAALVNAHGGIVRSKFVEPNGLTIEIPYSGLIGLAAEDAIQYAEPPLPGFFELNAENRVNTQVSILQAAPYGLSGQGVTVLVYDGGTIRTTHVDFQGRATNGDTDAVSSHATHVSGTIGGAGVQTANNRGMAPGVLLVNYGFEVAGGLTEGFLYTNPGDMQQDYGDAILNRGADISNNSIGSNTAPNGFNCLSEGDYGLASAVIDGIVRGSVSNGEPFRVIWANGNERQSTRCLGTDGWASPFHSTAPPSCAKNHITVGATIEQPLTNPGQSTAAASFTSFGPSDDGRLKPDIVAPGVNVLSTTSTSDTAYTSLSGTSMASPTVCGIGALILEDFRNHYPGMPDFRNSTLKVWLAHTAKDQIAADDDRGPDYRYGYGLVQAQQAVELMRSGNWFEGTVGQGEAHQFFVIVPPGASELRVTCAWDDPPGPPVALGALVNDLDVRVYDSGGNQYFPWTLNSTRGSDLDAAAVRTGPDRLNNIEQVVVDNPAPGAYRVEIYGFNVPQGPQVFSVAATPQLVNCSSQGIIGVNDSRIACGQSLTIQVVDCDLNTSNDTVQTVTINVASTSDPAGVSLLLTETDPASATFAGTITTGPFGQLSTADGDTITATYNDADNGEGSPAVAQATSLVDCTPPTITNISVDNITPTSARVTVQTNEPVKATVSFGGSCGALNNSASAAAFDTIHQITINFAEAPVVYFAVDVIDQAENTATDNNGGSCFEITQPVLGLPFREDFNGSSIDLNNWSLNNAVGVNSLGVGEPSPPNSLQIGTVAGGSLTSQFIDLSSAGPVRLSYWYQRVAGTNGPEANEDLIFAYLNSSGQYVELRREAGSGPDMTHYERVEMALPAAALHAGFKLRITSGGTTNDQWFVDDVRIEAAGTPTAMNMLQVTANDTPTTFALNGVDPTNDPLTYTIVSLPANGTLSDPFGGVIATVPYTLLNGAGVTFTPAPGFFGDTYFGYEVSDGTYTSGVGYVTVAVELVRSLPFVDNFNGVAIDTNNWLSSSGATVDAAGSNEPSPPNSLHFNGAGALVSHTINLAGLSAARLTYWFQKPVTDPPEANDDLIFSYRNALGNWVELRRELGSGPTMTNYQQVEVNLPPDALHSGFRLEIRSAVSATSDDWFVDDVSIVIPNAPEASDVAALTAANMAVMVTLDGSDPNDDPISYTIRSLPANGSLSDPNGGAINGVPYTLVGGGAQVLYTPNNGYFGSDSFTYEVTDGTYTSGAATVSLIVELTRDLPFFDNFDASTSFDPFNWDVVTNVTIDAVGLNEPSAPNSLRLNGDPVQNGDMLISQSINLTPYSDATLTYYFQVRGGGDSPESGDDLFFEYRTANNTWAPLSTQLGSLPDMTNYQFVSVALPPAAMHSSFRLRIRSNGTVGPFDDWFVDNVSITGTLAALLGDMNCDGQLSVSDISGFVLALTDPAGYAAAFPDCDVDNADVNQDGTISVSDIAGFVSLLTGG
jgi:hypothetical protein